MVTTSKYGRYLTPKYALNYSFNNYVQALAGLGITLSFAKFAGASDYGLYAFGLIWVNIVSTVVQFGSEKTLVLNLVQSNDSAKMFKTSLAFRGLCSIFAVVFSIGYVMSADLDTERGAIVITATIAGCLWAISLKDWYDYSGKLNLHALLQTISRILNLLIVLSFFYMVVDHISLYAIAALLGCRLTLVAAEYVLIRNLSWTGSVTISDIKQIFKDNIWISMAVIGNLLMSQGNQIILESKNGTEDLGIYAFAFQIIVIVKLFQAQLVRLVRPLVSHRVGKLDDGSRLRFFYKLMFLSVSLVLIIILPIYWLAPIFVSKFLPSEFKESIGILNILLVWTIVTSAGLVNSQFILSLKLNKIYFASAMLSGVFSLFLATLFIGMYGAKGAALSLLIAHSLAIFTMIFVAISHLRKTQKLDS